MAVNNGDDRTPTSQPRRGLAQASPRSPSVQRDHACEIRRIIELESPRTIDDVARRLNLSQSHLKHVFKRETGLPLGRSLIERRLQKAADLLTQSRLSIKEIAYLSGYRHTSSFIRAFERWSSCAPQSYRCSMRKPKS